MRPRTHNPTTPSGTLLPVGFSALSTRPTVDPQRTTPEANIRELLLVGLAAILLWTVAIGLVILLLHLT